MAVIVRLDPSATDAVDGRVTVGVWLVLVLLVMVTVTLADAVSEPSFTVTVIVTVLSEVTCGAVKVMVPLVVPSTPVMVPVVQL